jgi:uncharacterized surface protein with fasciclin (FAS1) repeats
MSTRTVLLAAAPLALLAGCNARGEGETPEASGGEAAGTVAAAVAASDEHRKLAAALSDTQLAPVLDGNGDYTVLAPSDAAFEALGKKGSALSAEDQRPLLSAVLRGHILPGQVTPEAIARAIARKKGPVEMRTMAGTTVTFAEAGERFTVSNGGAAATLARAATTASNGAVLPIDKVMLPVQ